MPRNYDDSIPLANYTEETRSQLRRLEQIVEEDRFFGRIILLDGPPGTGKSFYIKRLVSKLLQASKIKAINYYIGDGIEHLDIDYCLLSRLMIFEDADYVLGSKYERNSNVAKVLNFSSGFFEPKSLFVFSSNLEHADIDPAFTRDGRMLARVEFRTFTKAAAEEWLLMHGCVAELENDSYSLANLYAIANKYEKVEDPLKKAGIGFGTAA